MARGELSITTKIWDRELRARQARLSLKESLHKLREDQVDLTWIHESSLGGAVAISPAARGHLPPGAWRIATKQASISRRT